MCVCTYKYTYIYIYILYYVFTFQAGSSAGILCGPGCGWHVSRKPIVDCWRMTDAVTEHCPHGGVHKWGYPKMVGLYGTILSKWMMTGGTPMTMETSICSRLFTHVKVSVVSPTYREVPAFGFYGEWPTLTHGHEPPALLGPATVP